MSQLALYSGREQSGREYSGHEYSECGSTFSDEPQIYSFTEFASRLKATVKFVQRDSVEHSARLRRQNQICPECARATVDPVELRDGRIGRNGAIIPGTGSLVGFSCNACGHEWPV